MAKYHQGIPKVTHKININRASISEAMLTAKTKKLLSVFIFKLANNALKRSHRSSQDPKIGILEVYILSVTTLEAFINELCLEQMDKRRENHESTQQLKKMVCRKDDNQYRILKEKYELLPQLLWGKRFNKGDKLWNDFSSLIDLRNAIVHYTPKWEEPGYVPKYLKSIYNRIIGRQNRDQPKNLSFEELFNSNKPLFDRICNEKLGQWALDTTSDMIKHIISFWNRRDSIRETYVIMFGRSGIRIDDNGQ